MAAAASALYSWAAVCRELLSKTKGGGGGAGGSGGVGSGDGGDGGVGGDGGDGPMPAQLTRAAHPEKLSDILICATLP